MTDHLFLSPHFDDAIGSCGGTMWRLHVAGHQVRTVTVFGGDETAPLSRGAVRFHAAARMSGVNQRRTEDEAACRMLRCARTHLDYPEAIYRRGSDGGHLYPKPRSILGSVAAGDAGLADSLANELVARLPVATATVYCPMAIGGHVDHLVTRDCGLRLAGRGIEVIFYADFYYSVGRLAGAARSTHDVRLTTVEFARKVLAFSTYSSQVRVLFGHTPGMMLHFLRHGRRERLVPAGEFAAEGGTDDCRQANPPGSKIG